MTEISIIGGGRGNPNVAYPMATVTDTPITLTNQSPRNIMLTGSASGVNVSMGVCTDLPVGYERTIFNASTEFVVIDNGAGGTLFELLGPDCTAEITLKTAGSAAGTWTTKKEYPAGYHLYYNDFDRKRMDNTPEGAIVRNSAGSLCICRHTSKKFGEILQNASAVADYSMVEFAGYGASGTVFQTGKARRIRFIFDTYALSSAAQEYDIRLGFFDKINGDAPTAGCYFNVSRLGILSGITVLSSTPTELAGSAVKRQTDADQTVADMVINSALNRVDFWQNGVRLGSSTTNIPNLITQTGIIGQVLVRTVGAGVQQLTSDLVIIEGA